MRTPDKQAPEARARSTDSPPQHVDDERKRLLAAILEFSSLLRRPEPTRKRRSSQVGIGRTMQKHGLEQRHASSLLTVALYGPMTVTQLANRHRVTLKTASLIAVELERAGLIERREDPADRRRTIVAIARGKERAVEEGLNRRAAHLQRALDRLTSSQRDGLITGLEVLAEEMARDRDQKASVEPKHRPPSLPGVGAPSSASRRDRAS